MTEFKVGDLVKHRAAFLQSVGWYTDVPTDGKVITVNDRTLRVAWCDSDRLTTILKTNVLLAGKPDLSGL